MGFGAALPEEDARDVDNVFLAERFHWTLDYIEGLDMMQRERLLSIIEGIEQYRTLARSRK